MKKFLGMLLCCLLCMLLVVSCSSKNIEHKSDDNRSSKNSELDFHSIINEKGITIQERFNTPKDYKRTSVEKDSFEEYLRAFPLKPHGSEVHYFDGRVKKNNSIYDGVLDIDVGERDLQQCADAVMRLRAEYLYKNKKYDDIHFNFVGGFNAEYSKWKQGYRISMSGNKATWIKTASPSTDYESFRKYMNIVFAYAGTASLHKELNSVNIKDMKIGDVFIQTGNPYGHAVIVVDMAENSKGEKAYMLAQSYTPAQDIQILSNRNNIELSPWYSLDSGEIVSTPEWKFTINDLKRF